MKLREWTGREYLALGAVVVTLTLLAGGWAVQRGRQAAPPAGAETFVLPARGDGDAEAPPAAEDAPAPPSPAPEKLTVYVTGAVKRPGVYLLKPDSHVYQAIHAAGGFKANARQDALNLAEKVRDADQINVPTKTAVAAATAAAAPSRRSSAPPPVVAFAPLPSRRSQQATPAPRATPFATIIPGGDGQKEPRERGRVLGVPPVPVVGPAPESAPPAPGAGEAPPGGGESSAPPRTAASAAASGKLRSPGDGTVHLNAATSAELQRLPGVGPSTAEKILAYRRQIGRFTDAKQLMDVKGIGEKKYAKMEPFLAL